MDTKTEKWMRAQGLSEEEIASSKAQERCHAAALKFIEKQHRAGMSQSSTLLTFAEALIEYRDSEREEFVSNEIEYGKEQAKRMKKSADALVGGIQQLKRQARAAKAGK
jgi:hypothetical protein